MIVQVWKLGTGFKGEVAYLLNGHLDSLDPDRVDWFETRNLPTNDPVAAARIMASTARDAGSKQRPVYHFSISFDYGDAPNREMMRRIVDRLLRDLRQEEHQAILIAHRDRAHGHVHVVINRVHPTRLSVWSNWKDYWRIERSLREQERELGLRQVPGWLFPVFDVDGNRLRPARLVRGDPSFLERARLEAGPHLAGARSWGELERGLAAHGLSVEMKGRGMVVTDGLHEVKASEIDRAFSRGHLEGRLGIHGEYRLRQVMAERTLNERAARVEQAAAQEQQPATTSRAPAVAAPADLQPPQRTPQPIQGPGEISQPAIVRPAAAPAPQLVTTPTSAQRSAPVHPRVEAATELINMGAAVQEAITTLGRAQNEANAAERKAAALKARAEAFPGAVEHYKTESASVYADPKAARLAIAEWTKIHGLRETMNLIRKSPERFGALIPGEDGRMFAWLRRRTYGRARSYAALLAVALEHAVQCKNLKPQPDELADAEALARTANAAADRAHAVRAKLPYRSPESFALEAAGLLQPLLTHLEPEELVRQLRARVTPGAVPMALKALQLASDLARGPERESGGYHV